VNRGSGGTFSDARGAVLVEFALVLPVLLLIVVGIMDFGLLFRQQQVVINAAREGARMATLVGYTEADVQSRVQDYLTAGGVTATPTTARVPTRITPASGSAFNAWEVRVDVPYTFSMLGPIAGLFGSSFGTVTLRGAATMRVEVTASGS
jgi:Flp pilus assembly protein TadG